MLNDKLLLSKYRFTLEALDNITLPVYKGSTFHGGFGHALMKISPTWYRYFFEPGLNKKGDWPKPFVILPPLDELESYPKGHQFHCELTLFGEATQHYAIAQAAIEYLGMEMGLGHQQGKYKVISIDRAIAGNTATSSNHSVSAQEIIKTRIPTLSENNLSIHFPSRLRLKQHNKLYRQTPSFQLVFERLAGRLKTLEKAYSDVAENTQDEDYQALQQQAAKIATHSQDIHWDDWNRFSGRQKKWMKFGGLVGSVCYQGDLEPFLPCLALGEWIHIGGKTSFGLGKYVLKTNNGNIQ